MVLPSLENKQKVRVGSVRKISRKPKEEKASRHFWKIEKRQLPNLLMLKKEVLLVVRVEVSR